MPIAKQVFYKANEDISYMDYEAEECDSGLHAFFHDMTQIELQDNWARCWCVSVCSGLSCLLHHNVLSSKSASTVCLLAGKNGSDSTKVPSAVQCNYRIFMSKWS